MTNTFCLVYLHNKSLGCIKFKRGHNLNKIKVWILSKGREDSKPKNWAYSEEELPLVLALPSHTNIPLNFLSENLDV